MNNAAARRWLCQIYAARGELNDAAWEKFKEFCEQQGYTDEPAPGRRTDGRDRWDVFEENLK